MSGCVIGTVTKSVQNLRQCWQYLTKLKQSFSIVLSIFQLNPLLQKTDKEEFRSVIKHLHLNCKTPKEIKDVLDEVHDPEFKLLIIPLINLTNKVVNNV